MTEPPGGWQVGSAAQEATKLLGAMQDWARTRSGRLVGAEHTAAGASECHNCPVCQGITVLRQVRPETVEHLLDATASFVAAVKAAFVSPTSPEPAPRSTGIERIDIQEPDA